MLDVAHRADLPTIDTCAGVAITGSHAMVTDNLPWSDRPEKWLPSSLLPVFPLLGICCGHQLLARAAGGEVGYHPTGIEIGTVTVNLLPDCGDDSLFRSFPAAFPAHVTHPQAVLTLPPEAVRLATNEHEANHANHLGNCAWVVQFHPESLALFIGTEMLLRFVHRLPPV